jgi:hypothetical protein
MTFDEHALTDALHGIAVDVAPDLASRARTGGRRRLMRRRSLTAAGAVAVGAATVPVTVAVSDGWGEGRVEVTTSSNASSLYVPPPPAGSQCNAGFASKASAADHADLLLLPPGQQVRYAYVRDETSDCSYPHVALVAWQPAGDSDHQSIGAGVVVEGPNAPTAVQAGAVGPAITFAGDTGHLPVRGQAATEFTIDDYTNAYWTEPDGGQWHAKVREMSQHAAVALLNRLVLDSRTGTAALGGASADGWGTVSDLPDRSSSDTAEVISQWSDPEGHLVDMTVTQRPDWSVYERAAEFIGPTQIVAVRGGPGLLAPSGGNGGNAYSLTWQESNDVEVDLAIKGATTEEIQQVAESLQLASPDDPRISTD